MTHRQAQQPDRRTVTAMPPMPPPTVTPETPPATKKVYPWTGHKLLFISGSILALIMGASVLANAGDEPTTRDYGDHNAAIEACHSLTQNRLKSPATADFPYYTDAGVTATQIGDAWHVSSFVDSENGFGANVRTSFECGVSLAGSTWTLDAWTQT